MADEIILVVDADPEIDQKIISTLEAEGYLVFACANHVVTNEMADRSKPALIFMKPLSPTAEGFKPCRTIHTIQKLQNVPIVLLASLKGMLEPKHTEYYGIVDFLRLNFTAEELIAKTNSVLASLQLSAEPEEEAFLPVKKVATFEEPPAAEEPGILNQPPAEQQAPLNKTPYADLAEKEECPIEDEIQKPSPARRSFPSQAYRRERLKRPSLLPWLIGVMILAFLGGGGFFAYQYFMPLQKPASSEPIKAVSPVALEKKEAGIAPSSSPVASPPAPASDLAAPTQAPAEAPAASQPVPTKKDPSYAAQVGAFKTEEIAAILVKKLKGKGYEAYLQEGVTKDNAPIIRVLVGNFPDRKAAVKLAAEIQAKEQIKTTIFTN